MADQTKRQQLESHLAARALQDPAFRERLMKDPKAAIEQEIGLRFPEGVDISVHEEKLKASALCRVAPVIAHHPRCETGRVDDPSWRTFRM